MISLSHLWHCTLIGNHTLTVYLHLCVIYQPDKHNLYHVKSPLHHSRLLRLIKYMHAPSTHITACVALILVLKYFSVVNYAILLNQMFVIMILSSFLKYIWCWLLLVTSSEIYLYIKHVFVVYKQCKKVYQPSHINPCGISSIPNSQLFNCTCINQWVVFWHEILQKFDVFQGIHRTHWCK